MKKTRKSTTDMADLVHGAGQSEVQLNQNGDLYSDPDFKWDPDLKKLVLTDNALGYQLPDGFILTGQNDLGGTGVGYEVTRYDNVLGTSDRDYIYTVPDGVDKIYVTGSGGGGGGSGSGATYGRGGGGGHAIYKQEVQVTSGQQIPIRIGRLGEGGGNYADGTDGGDTIFNVNNGAPGVNVITIPGGKGGNVSGSGAAAGTQSGGLGGVYGGLNAYANMSGGGSMFGPGGEMNSYPNNRGGGYGGGGAGAQHGSLGEQHGGDGAAGFILIEAGSNQVSTGGGTSETIGGGSGNFVTRYLETNDTLQTSVVVNEWGTGTYLIVVDDNSDMDVLHTNQMLVPDYLEPGSRIYGGDASGGDARGGVYYLESDNSFHCDSNNDQIVEIKKFESFAAYADFTHITIDSSTDGPLDIEDTDNQPGQDYVYNLANFSGDGYNSALVRELIVYVEITVDSTGNGNGKVNANYPDGTSRRLARLEGNFNANTHLEGTYTVPINSGQTAVTLTTDADNDAQARFVILGVTQTKAVVVGGNLVPTQSALFPPAGQYPNDGPFNWVVPAGVTNIRITASAGGGGGGVGFVESVGASHQSLEGAGGGASGDWFVEQYFTVQPGETLTIQPGDGGNNGYYWSTTQGTAAENGGNSTITCSVSTWNIDLQGGDRGGSPDFAGGNTGGTQSGNGYDGGAGGGSYNAPDGFVGENSSTFSGGGLGTGWFDAADQHFNNYKGGGGGGGASEWADGGPGGNGNTGASENGGSGSLGSGGGGGGAGNEWSSAAGGPGGHGFIKIEW